MNAVERGQLAVLVIVAVALLACAPARAQTPLTNVASSGDPDWAATGDFTYAHSGSVSLAKALAAQFRSFFYR
jgi:hypothetical protein